MSSTVGELYERVRSLCPPRSLDTYDKGFRRLVERFGDRLPSEVTTAELSRQRDDIAAQVGRDRVAQALARGRQLRSYAPEMHGHGAAENYVRAARFFFRVAVEDGHLARSPADRVRVPPRPPAPERPLTSTELADLWRVASTTGNDPELDCLMLDVLRHTAARRAGMLNLRLSDVDVAGRSVLLGEKGDRLRTQPISAALAERMRAFACRRGAISPADPVMRTKNGRPVTYRRLDRLFDRLDANTDWSGALDVGCHWIRHTTLADVAAVRGIRVAAAFAGHEDQALGTIGRYTKVPYEEIVAAYEAVFGPRG